MHVEHVDHEPTFHPALLECEELLGDQVGERSAGLDLHATFRERLDVSVPK